jgi:flagellar hook assembly protein FlgD
MTTVRYRVAMTGEVQVVVHDIQGRQVRKLVTGRRLAGEHQAVWDGRDEEGREIASGVYLVRMQAGVFTAVRKIVLLK